MIGTKRDVVQLWGREFDIVRQGLSQPQLVTFVNELINENQTLNEKVKCLVHLEKLAGQTVTEADKLAASIKNKANKEAANILQTSQEEAEEMKAKAREELNQFLARSRERLGAELRKRADEVYRRMFSRVEGMLAEVWPPEMTLKLTEIEPEKAPSVPEQDEDGLEGLLQEALLPQTLSEASETAVEQPEPLPEQDEVTREAAASEEAAPASYEGKADLDVLPPVDLAQLMKLRKELRKIPQLKVLQITTSQKKGSRISILLDEPIPLIDTLRAMPEIHEAASDTPIETPADPETQPTEHVDRISIRLAPIEQA